MTRMTLTRGKVIAFGATLALALLALAPGAWAPALAQTAGTATPTPEPLVITAETHKLGSGPSTLSLAPSVQMSIPAGALPDGATLTVASVAVPSGGGFAAGIALQGLSAQLGLRGISSLPPAAEDGGLVLSVFNLDVSLGDSEPTINEPVTMTFELTPEQLAEADGDANNATLQFWDVTTSAWIAVECSGSGSTVTCTLPHFSTWALSIEADAGDDGQVTTPSPADTGAGVLTPTDEGGSNLGLLLGAVAALAVTGGLGARFATRRARQ